MSAAFEGWACVELFGHRVVYAHVSEVVMFGAAFARLDIPSDPPTYEFKNATAIYGLTPIAEELVRARHRPRRLDRQALAAFVEGDDPVEGEPDEESSEGVCGNCNEPLGDRPTQRVAIDDGSDYALWHERCAVEHAERLDDATDSDAPIGGV